MNLYLIKNDNVHHRITNDNYRLPTKKLLNNLNEIKKKYELNKTKNNHKKNYNEYIKSTEYFLEKINKMINFLLCFNLKTLKLSFYKLYFLWSPYGKEMTNCQKNSLLQNDNFMNPYYSTSELINLSLNLN